MAIRTTYASDAAMADCLELAALLKTEAVLRILKGRTTAEEEAARMQVDTATVTTWLESTFRALSRALDEGLTRQDIGANRRVAADQPIKRERMRGVKAF